ncbi:MAG: hypothetical protein ACR2JW_06020 [Thermomicrobiales bacterium]
MLRIRVAWARGDYDGAATLLEENIRTIRTLGDQRGLGFLLAYLSGVSLDRGEHRRAETLARESLASFRAIGDKRGVGYALIFLAGAARDRGDVALAAARYQECLALISEFGPRVEIAWALEGCALLHAMHGEAARAFRVLGAASALRETIGAPLPPIWHATIQRRLVPARTEIGEAGEAAATEIGHTLSLEEAIAQAVEAPRRSG